MIVFTHRIQWQCDIKAHELIIKSRHQCLDSNIYIYIRYGAHTPRTFSTSNVTIYLYRMKTVLDIRVWPIDYAFRIRNAEVSRIACFDAFRKFDLLQFWAAAQ